MCTSFANCSNQPSRVQQCISSASCRSHPQHGMPMRNTHTHIKLHSPQLHHLNVFTGTSEGHRTPSACATCVYIVLGSCNLLRTCSRTLSRELEAWVEQGGVKVARGIASEGGLGGGAESMEGKGWSGKGGG